MRSISDTISRLDAMKSRFGAAAATAPATRLSAFGAFGSNPGALNGFSYTPADLPRNAPLVVVLHGCTQTAAGYDHGAGWSRLADRHGFAVLYPEQRRENNANLCFNWFVPSHTSRGSGEALSIAQMVGEMVARHDLDPARVFVNGLSAGGAMTSVMLATYPELFSGGAVIAGLPYGCAASIPEAFDRMRGHGLPSEARLKAAVLGASDHRGPWPSLAIWHGGADRTVSPANMEAIVSQWRDLHGLQGVQPEQSMIGRHSRRLYRDAAGHVRIEAIDIAGMGHGTPLSAADDIGAVGPFMLDAQISSTRHIARSWSLTETGSALALPTQTEQTEPEAQPLPAWKRSGRAAPRPAAAVGVGKVIEDALRAAGLMR